MKEVINMRKASVLLIVLASASTLFAGNGGDAIVIWENIVGVITAPGVNNPVAD
jgi:hypothetical protein